MNNIDDKIKKEFLQREIQPSKMAWDTLNNKLDKQANEKPTNKMVFFRIAVIFIGLLVGFSYFFNTVKNVETIDINNSKVVVTEKIDTTSINNIKNPVFNKTKEEIASVSSTKLVKKTIKNSSPNKKSSKNKKVVIGLPSNNTTQYAIVRTHKNVKSKRNTSSNSLNINSKSNDDIQIENTDIALQTVPKKIEIINEKPTINNKILKEHKVLMNSSDKDIDNMLASAIGEINIENKKINIQSNKLKYAVENQLNIESKNRMYYLIKTGVDTVESIIVSNNN